MNSLKLVMWIQVYKLQNKLKKNDLFVGFTRFDLLNVFLFAKMKKNLRVVDFR